MTADTHKKKKSEWLVMIYLAGDNNLSANSIALLQDLEAARHTRNVRVLAAFDSATPIPKGARYVEIKRHRDEPNAFARRMDWPLHNDLVTPGHIVVNPDFCCPPGTAHPPSEETIASALGRFLDFARRHYKAKRYMLILFGHGTLVAGNTFLADTQPPSYLKLDDLAEILHCHFGRKLDILGFDNCAMNGIETAVQLHGLVDFTIGSQGLMLTVGWPFRRIIETVSDHHSWDSKRLSEAILRVCARNVLDFTFMERSTDQSICNINKFGQSGRIVSAVKGLSGALQKGLVVDRSGQVVFPIVRDVVRLARLDAQAFFGELFVDLYDFCELLILRANDVLKSFTEFEKFLSKVETKTDAEKEAFKRKLLGWGQLAELEKIVIIAQKVLDVFVTGGIVPRAYYVGPKVQYSHGISIFFPLTLPEGPFTFEPVEGSGAEPEEYEFITPFEVYEDYLFAGEHYGDWARCLIAFFKATLRDVRREDNCYATDKEVFFKQERMPGERVVPAVDLQKTDSNTAEDELQGSPIKNYPRRFYISPADCTRKLPVFGLSRSPEPDDNNVVEEPGRVSYLGWNIRGLVAEAIGLPPEKVVATPTPPGCSE
jgi:cysteine peptidase C11 family protein